MSSKLYLCLAFLLSSSGFGFTDRCADDPVHSYKVCKAIKSFLETRPTCDPAEVIRLRRKIIFLKRAVSVLLSQRNNRSCPGGIFGNECYFLLDNNGTSGMVQFEEAQSACLSRDGRLVAIDNKPQYDFLYDFVNTTAKDIVSQDRELVLVWTGASYVNGKIRLYDNRVSNFSQWSVFHPRNRPDRNRIAIAVSTTDHFRGMLDMSPSRPSYPLCQKRL